MGMTPTACITCLFRFCSSMLFMMTVVVSMIGSTLVMPVIMSVWIIFFPMLGTFCLGLVLLELIA